MARKVHSDGTVLIWGTGGAIVLSRLAPGVVYLIGLQNFDGPFEDGPMCDFDRELEAHGSLDLFIDVRTVERGSRNSREPWKVWAAANRSRLRSYLLVRSNILHMVISVIAMAAGNVAHSYKDEGAFLNELARRVPGIRSLPTVPGWVATTLGE